MFLPATVQSLMYRTVFMRDGSIVLRYHAPLHPFFIHSSWQRTISLRVGSALSLKAVSAESVFQRIVSSPGCFPRGIVCGCRYQNLHTIDSPRCTLRCWGSTRLASLFNGHGSRRRFVVFTRNALSAWIWRLQATSSNVDVTLNSSSEVLTRPCSIMREILRRYQNRCGRRVAILSFQRGPASGPPSTSCAEQPILVHFLLTTALGLLLSSLLQSM
mmetsp:Transcript_9301/g.19894  ORF Transcript_9301/g.19894 Transcript_9301/m.19894 type:complete len:216 (+) Transcript_9301:9408-10055(+)